MRHLTPAPAPTLIAHPATSRLPFSSGRRGSAGLRIAAIASALLTCGPHGAAMAQTAAPPQGGEACSGQLGGVPSDRLRSLSKGFSLPGLTDRLTVKPPSMVTLRSLREAGLTHIRLPLTLELLSDAFSPKEVQERALKQIDHAVDMLTGMDFAVSLDMHPEDRFQKLHEDNPAKALAVLKDVWGRLAARYAAKSEQRVFFEVLNEPVVKADLWAVQGPEVVKVIRAAAPRHTIIYGPTFFQRVEALEALTPLPDDNVVYAIHFYDPMSFTHQGQNWGADRTAPRPPIPFPASMAEAKPAIDTLRMRGDPKAAEAIAEQFAEPWDRARIRTVFQGVAQWSKRFSRPVIVNEFGVLSFQADPQSRANWIRAVRAAAQASCIGWTHWEYADGFGFVRRVGLKETLDPVVGPAVVSPLPPD
ncbi:cellulase family glycosylhydrolase [Alsobacter sp. KACC 23698]|uniref:Exo-1,3-beta-glucanase D n=1 Tax=Alsobacter sp. KACC 23698 TaxID=3149229 RepID=A0AAU7JK25_9HYPH